jgi:rhodanese-related sulfurtransferase
MAGPDRNFIALLGVAFIVCCISCGCFALDDSEPENESQTTYRDLKLPEARFLIENNINSSTFVIIDCREPEEFDGGHIPGAVNICYRSAGFSNDLNALNRGYQYLIYSGDDQLSANVRHIMEKNGFLTIYRLEGGYAAWVGSGYPVATTISV